MPVYQFNCKECSKKFTQTMSVADLGKNRVTCPKCKSRKVEQQIAAFFAVTSKKS